MVVLVVVGYFGVVNVVLFLEGWVFYCCRSAIVYDVSWW